MQTERDADYRTLFSKRACRTNAFSMSACAALTDLYFVTLSEYWRAISPTSGDLSVLSPLVVQRRRRRLPGLSLRREVARRNSGSPRRSTLRCLPTQELLRLFFVQSAGRFWCWRMNRMHSRNVSAWGASTLERTSRSFAADFAPVEAHSRRMWSSTTRKSLHGERVVPFAME